MKIPEYDETLCPYCINKDKCNRKKFKVKTKKADRYNPLKYSYCKDYKYTYLKEE